MSEDFIQFVRVCDSLGRIWRWKSFLGKEIILRCAPRILTLQCCWEAPCHFLLLTFLWGSETSDTLPCVIIVTLRVEACILQFQKIVYWVISSHFLCSLWNPDEAQHLINDNCRENRTESSDFLLSSYYLLVLFSEKFLPFSFSSSLNVFF